MLNLIKSKWRHFLYNYKTNGFTGVIKKVAYRLRRLIYVEERWWILELDLKNYGLQPSVSLERQEATFDDLIQMKYEKAIYFPEAIRRRFEAGAKCNLFFLNGKLANIRWTMNGHLDIIEGVRIAHGKCQGVFDSVTVPELQRQGVGRSAHITVAHMAKEAGYERLITAVHPGNVASLKSLAYAGYRKLYLLTWRRVLGVTLWTESERAQDYAEFPERFLPGQVR